MKRSEMEELITIILRDLSNEPRELIADVIMNTIEEHGMLPPFNYHCFVMDGDHADKKNKLYCQWDNE